MARERIDGDAHPVNEPPDGGKAFESGHGRQPPAACLWLTGLSGAGKSTIADALERRLRGAGRPVCTLDGDKLRRGLNRDLGYTDADRAENVRRLGEVAHLMVEAGMLVVVSAISPFRADRARARALFAPDRFFEVYIDTPLEECIRRDPKGLYARVMAGRIQNFTGFDSGYEPPQAPDIRIDTAHLLPGEAAEFILSHACRAEEDPRVRAPSNGAEGPRLAV